VRRYLIIILLSILVLSIPIYATEVKADMLVSVDSVGTVDSDQFVAKIERMASSLWQIAVKVMVPITIIILIVGGILAIFFDEARKRILYAIAGLVLVSWAPMLVGLIMKWIQS